MKFKHIITFLLFSLTLSGCQISKSYTVTWENYDGTVLETDSVTYGSTPTYDGATPSKGGSAQYTYTFSGWSPSVVAVTSDATYIAQFSSAVNSYNITWENYDGTVLETDSVAYGSTPTYDGATPSKDGTDQYTYTFSGWSPSVVAVTSDATYIAQFSSAINSYTITWENYDGTVLETDSVAYGSTPTYDGATPSRDGNEEGYYAFSGWSPSVTIVNGDQTYTAQYGFYIYNDFLEYFLSNDETSYSVRLRSEVTPISIKIPSIYLGKPVTSIGYQAFYYCRSLTSIVIPNSVTSIGYGAFWGCSSLTSVVIPDSVTSIGDYAFYYCSSLTSIVIPNSVTFIGDYAFYYCSSLTSINVNDDNSNYSSLDGVLYDKDKTTLINYPCAKLDNVFAIPNSVTSIGNSAFSSCTSLTSIVIPNSVTSIGDYAFYNCSSLTSIVIPNSVTSIGDYAFSYCSSLTIYAEASSEPSGWSSSWNSSNRPVVWGYVG
ncbi:MAG: leucine-rich repeat domain-containing protein [Bacilli bacterium]|jgi:hypothetical protein|nr:leucine-rich repeat domain-containing protein [Bacilli bacterium]